MRRALDQQKKIEESFMQSSSLVCGGAQMARGAVMDLNCAGKADPDMMSMDHAYEQFIEMENKIHELERALDKERVQNEKQGKLLKGIAHAAEKQK